EEVAGGVEIEAAPVPPPSNVQLMGVMAVGQEPVAILLDTSVNPEQKSVRKGDMFGEYQVGDIASSGLTLLGTGGQQFQIPLKVGAASGGVPAAAQQPVRYQARSRSPRGRYRPSVRTSRPTPENRRP